MINFYFCTHKVFVFLIYSPWLPITLACESRRSLHAFHSTGDLVLLYFWIFSGGSRSCSLSRRDGFVRDTWGKLDVTSWLFVYAPEQSLWIEEQLNWIFANLVLLANVIMIVIGNIRGVIITSTYTINLSTNTRRRTDHRRHKYSATTRATCCSEPPLLIFVEVGSWKRMQPRRTFMSYSSPQPQLPMYMICK